MKTRNLFQNITILMILSLFLSSVSFAQEKRPLVVNDIFALKDLSDPQISPDGRWAAYVVETLDAKKDQSNSDIYMVSLQGGEPVRLTSHNEEDKTPRWSPDNRYLAFLSKRNKKKQVYLLDRKGGEPVQLTRIKQGVSDFSWSPDGKKLALVVGDLDPDEVEESIEPKEGKKDKKTPKPIVITRLQFKYDETGYMKELYDHIYVMDVETRSIKQITSGPYDDSGAVWSAYTSTPQWSPDGKSIVFVSNRTENPDANRNTDLFLVPSDGGEVKKLTTNEGTDEVPQWSPDGKWIVYQTTVQPDLIWYDTTEIAVIPAEGGTPRILTRDLDRNCWNARFSNDGESVYFLLEDHGKQTLARIGVNASDLVRDMTGENVVSDYDVGSQNIVAFLASRHHVPYEVFLSTQGRSKQLTFMNRLDSILLGSAERVNYKSYDGTPMEAFVTKPPGFDPSKKYPLILWIHGGPTAQYSEEFEFLSQLLAAKGYVVLRPNPRGSTGYGEKFSKAIWADWGNKDYDDVMAGVDHVISLGYVDSKKLGVGGWSYGGMLTDHVITKTDRFSAAISGASELNYFMDYGIDHYQHEWEKEMGLPWEKVELYRNTSPFFQIHKVKTPTLVVCGESDWNVPLANSEQLYQALKRLGIDTMLIIYPGEPHTIYTPSYQKDRYERYLAWFGHYLKGEPNKTPGSKK